VISFHVQIHSQLAFLVYNNSAEVYQYDVNTSGWSDVQVAKVQYGGHQTVTYHAWYMCEITAPQSTGEGRNDALII